MVKRRRAETSNGFEPSLGPPDLQFFWSGLPQNGTPPIHEPWVFFFILGSGSRAVLKSLLFVRSSSETISSLDGKPLVGEESATATNVKQLFFSVPASTALRRESSFRAFLA